MTLEDWVTILGVRTALKLPEAWVRRWTEPRWEVDGETLDRWCQLLFILAQRRPRAMSRMTPEAARSYYAAITKGTEAPPPRVASTETVLLDLRSGRREARIYRPEHTQPERPAPALLYFHGGGHTIGSLDTHDGLCRRLCATAGCVVIACDYRLAPEAPFPAAVEDCADAFFEVMARAVEFGIDAARVAVGGDSAGGNLGAVVAAIARDRGGPKPSLQLLIYPAVAEPWHPGRKNAGLQTGFGLDAPTKDWFTRSYLPDGDIDDPMFAPLRLPSHTGLPPAIVVTAHFDLLCPEGLEYASTLRDAGVRVTHLHYADLPHGFATMTAVPRAYDAMSEIGQALRAGLDA